MTALMGSHVDLGFDNLPAALSLVQAGKVRALAITSTTRIKELPDVPTAEELGVKNMSVDAWVSVMGPAGIPADRLSVLSSALLKTLAQPDIVRKLEDKAITIKATVLRNCRTTSNRDPQVARRHRDGRHQAGITRGASPGAAP